MVWTATLSTFQTGLLSQILLTYDTDRRVENACEKQVSQRHFTLYMGADRRWIGAHTDTITRTHTCNYYSTVHCTKLLQSAAASC